MSEPQSTPAGDPPSARHASWLKLFFDLVVVVAVAQVSHRLHDPTWAELGISLLLFGAIWLCWMSFTLYANIRADQTRTRVVLLAMTGIAVMAAAVQEADGDHAEAFALAYLAVRFLATRTWETTGTTLLAWPTAQVGAGVLPWIISLWVDGPGRYALWLAGLMIDIVAPIWASRDATEASLRERFDRRVRKAERHLARRRPGQVIHDLPVFRVAQIDSEHLAERLGLFVIIVLGEAVYRLVSVAGGVEWTGDLLWVTGGGFVIVVGLWWLTFEYGFSAAPHARLVELPVRVALPVHTATTASLMVMAAGLGSFVEHPDATTTASTGALLCGGLAGYFAATTIAAMLEGAPRRWVLGWGVPSVVVPAALAVFSPSVPVVAIVWILVAVVGWQVVYAQVIGRRT